MPPLTSVGFNSITNARIASCRAANHEGGVSLLRFPQSFRANRRIGVEVDVVFRESGGLNYHESSTRGSEIILESRRDAKMGRIPFAKESLPAAYERAKLCAATRVTRGTPSSFSLPSAIFLSIPTRQLFNFIRNTVASLVAALK